MHRVPNGECALAADRVERHRHGAGPWPCPTWSVGSCELAAGERTSVYLGADIAAAVKASGQPLVELIRRGLMAGTAEVAQQPAPVPAISSLSAIPSGEPSPGVLCMGPGCWERNTRKFGLRQLPLCPACDAALQGAVYVRPGAERARAIAGTAA